MPSTELRIATGALIACAWLQPSLAAAEYVDQAIGFAVDVGVAGTRDDLLVPRTFSGPRLAVGPQYVRSIGAGSLHLELHVSFAYVLDRDANPGVAFDYGLHAQYLLALGHAVGLRHAAGPALGVDTDIAGLLSWDDAHAYWIATRWLGLAWRGSTPAWQRTRWELAVELPVLGLLSRPDSYRHNKQDALTRPSFYLVDVLSDPEPVFWAQFQQLRASVDLWQTASSSFVFSGWALGAELRLVHVTEPRSAFTYHTTLRVRAAWGL